jgi:hypothetical protein
MKLSGMVLVGMLAFSGMAQAKGGDSSGSSSSSTSKSGYTYGYDTSKLTNFTVSSSTKGTGSVTQKNSNGTITVWSPSGSANGSYSTGFNRSGSRAGNPNSTH